MPKKRITKREARNLFSKKEPFLIGYKERAGDGASWDARQFKASDFDGLCAWFAWRYQLGTRGTVPYPVFYTIAE